MLALSTIHNTAVGAVSPAVTVIACPTGGDMKVAMHPSWAELLLMAVTLLNVSPVFVEASQSAGEAELNVLAAGVETAVSAAGSGGVKLKESYVSFLSDGSL